MSTTPTEPGTRSSYSYPGGGSLDLARLPIPGNAEFLVYVIVLAVISIATLVEDQYNIPQWADAVTWVTAAYLISRGLAKASRVLEQ